MDVELYKKKIFEKVKSKLEKQGFCIENQEYSRPWGGFFAINEKQSDEFANIYFQNLSLNEIKITGRISPKILIVAPEKRLSWQYHLRRAEIWKVIEGCAKVITSFTDYEGSAKTIFTGDIVRLEQGERHRLVGLHNWCILAEMWQHTSDENPSNEEDIIRLQDDFGRIFFS